MPHTMPQLRAMLTALLLEAMVLLTTLPLPRV